MGEFDIIERIRRRAAVADDVILGIGDDAALLAIPGDECLAVTTDTLNEGVHFGADDDPAGIGHKALAVSLSDLASMGARPRWAFLNLSLPATDDDWLEAFTGGLLDLAAQAGVSLAGGDTTLGARSVTVTLLGTVTRDRALTRSGARAGDRILVSGCPGLAGLALGQRRAGEQAATAAARALDRPVARVSLGLALAGVATACIDISDGLLADLGHIATASGCGADLRVEALPDHPAFRGLSDRQRWDLQLGGGDDYELCFCLAAEDLSRASDIAATLDVPLTEVGVMTASGEVVCRLADGSRHEPARSGFEHFRT